MPRLAYLLPGAHLHQPFIHRLHLHHHWRVLVVLVLPKALHVEVQAEAARQHRPQLPHLCLKLARHACAAAQVLKPAPQQGLEERGRQQLLHHGHAEWRRIANAAAACFRATACRWRQRYLQLLPQRASPAGHQSGEAAGGRVAAGAHQVQKVLPLRVASKRVPNYKIHKSHLELAQQRRLLPTKAVVEKRLQLCTPVEVGSRDLRRCHARARHLDGDGRVGAGPQLAALHRSAGHAALRLWHCPLRCALPQLLVQARLRVCAHARHPSLRHHARRPAARHDALHELFRHAAGNILPNSERGQVVGRHAGIKVEPAHARLVTFRLLLVLQARQQLQLRIPAQHRHLGRGEVQPAHVGRREAAGSGVDGVVGEQVWAGWDHLDAAELGPAQEHLVVDADRSPRRHVEQQQRPAALRQLARLVGVHLHRIGHRPWSTCSCRHRCPSVLPPRPVAEAPQSAAQGRQELHAGTEGMAAR
mmetsp:Transcript_44612/g.115440  ORF Transcript_44612/g.115440 Transcript_44612/m.115440 type:complete len:475 (+) Transcript_44612:109-1533(+)